MIMIRAAFLSAPDYLQYTVRMQSLSTFTESVYAWASKIPAGKVATYGQLAALAGKPNAARAVGMLMSKNTDTDRVPCHRVVASDGSLTGYAFGGTKAKRERLQKEGVSFSGDKVNLTTSLWKSTALHKQHR